MDGKIEYLNTDLDVVSTEDLAPLASAFAARGMFALHVSRADDGLWSATFETEESFDEPQANIAAMLDAVESLPAEQKAVWSRCDRREFNVGYDCGEEPWAFQQGLPSEVLSRMAAVGASLRWTLYPDREERAG